MLNHYLSNLLKISRAEKFVRHNDLLDKAIDPEDQKKINEQLKGMTIESPYRAYMEMSGTRYSNPSQINFQPT